MVENAPKIFFVSVVYLIISTLMSELEYRLPGTDAAYVMYLNNVLEGVIPSFDLFFSFLRPSGIALAFVLILLHPVLEVGYLRYCLNISRSQGGGYKDIFDGFLFFGKIILIRIITSVLIFLWSMLLIIPGIVASYRYRQAYYILFDAPEKGALQCIRESKQLMDGNKIDLLVLDLSFFGWFILDFFVVLLLPIPFSLPLLSIWLMPYLWTTRAMYYDFIIKRIVV